MKTAYFDCFSGISGDMTLGALIDAGADFEKLQLELKKLALDGYTLEKESVQRHGIEATNLHVHLHHEHGHSHHHHDHQHGRHLPEILEIIETSGIDEKAKQRATAVFRKLADAEAKVHGTTPDQIHFHEVGAVDAIVDIVGSCIALSLLEIDEIKSSPLPMGHGFVKCAHGILPIPPPAVVEITTGLPVYGVDVEGELVTPTGAAIMAALASEFGICPSMSLLSTGYGSGKSEFPGRPNLLRVMIGETEALDQIPPHEVSILESNLDDMNPEFFAPIMERLLKEGALDVFLTPILMKKGRPATLLTVLCSPDKSAFLSRRIIEETTTLGVRITQGNRFCCQREIKMIETCYGSIRVKYALLDGVVQTVSPEFEDCRQVSEDLGIPIKHVYDEAKKQALLAS